MRSDPDLKENLLIRFSVVSLAIMALIAVALSAIVSQKIQSDTLNALTAERIAVLNRWIFGSVTAGFIVVYLSLVGLVRRGWGTINRQQAALARMNQELQGANEELKRTQDGMVKTLNETKLWAQKLGALAQMSRAVTGSLDPQPVLNLVMKVSSELLDAPAAAVWALEGEKLILRASRGFQPIIVAVPPVPLGEGLTGRIAQDKESLIIPELLHDPRVKEERCVPEEVHAFAGVPLLAGDRCLGVLTVFRRNRKPFEADEVEMLSAFAQQAALAMENARLCELCKGMVVTGERERIAREMHDDLVQQLGYLHLRIGQLETNSAAVPIQAEIRTLKKIAATAYDEVRQAIFGLRTMVSRGLGLVPTLTEYLHDFSQQTGITVKLQIADEKAARTSAYAEVQLIRIIQEALTNVRKHARAKRAWVDFTMEGHNAKITVEDDGIGFDPDQPMQQPGRTGFGLQGMRERAELAGGTCTVESRPQAGTRVIVCLPVREDGKSE